MNSTTTKLSLDDFLNLPESDDRYELVDGELKPKVSQKFKYSITQLRLLTAINDWCEQQQIGRVLPEWGFFCSEAEMIGYLSRT